MSHCEKFEPNNLLRYRRVDCLVSPELNIEGNHNLNFINDTITMLSSSAPVLSDRHLVVLERQIARRHCTSASGGRNKTCLVMTDKQWRTWRDIRGLFLAMRYAHEHRAALSRMIPAPVVRLSIPMPEAVA